MKRWRFPRRWPLLQLAMGRRAAAGLRTFSFNHVDGLDNDTEQWRQMDVQNTFRDANTHSIKSCSLVCGR